MNEYKSLYIPRIRALDLRRPVTEKIEPKKDELPVRSATIVYQRKG